MEVCDNESYSYLWGTTPVKWNLKVLENWVKTKKKWTGWIKIHGYRREHRDMSRRKSMRWKNLCYSNFYEVTWGRGDSQTNSLFVLGVYRKPFLLALRPLLMKSVEVVMLQCCSKTMIETFILVLCSKGVEEICMYLVGKLYGGGSQVTSPCLSWLLQMLKPTCYSSPSWHTYMWSDPSEPLDMIVSGECLQDYPLNRFIYVLDILKLASLKRSGG